MILDAENQVSDSQAITSSAASSDYLDQGAARDLGVSDDVHLQIDVTETFAAAGDATLQPAIRADSDSAFGSAIVAAQLRAIAKADLVEGARFYVPLPPGLKKRYLQAYFTVASGPFTAGRVDAHFVHGKAPKQDYDDALDPIESSS